MKFACNYLNEYKTYELEALEHYPDSPRLATPWFRASFSSLAWCHLFTFCVT